LFYFTAILLGLGFSALAAGIFLSMRIFNIPDITTDGSYTLGGALSAVLLTSQMHFALVLPLVFLAGAIAGAMTGLIHTRLKVNALLSGILVMTSLYSINLAIMGRSNIPLISIDSLFSNESGQSISTGMQLLILVLFSLSIIFILSWLLRTDFGLALRATGNNEKMVSTLGINADNLKIIGLSIANGLTALSGYMIVQLQGYADINMGIGIIILGLGSVMMGEMLTSSLRTRNIFIRLICIITGAIIFRLILAFALTTGVDPVYLRLVVAVIVLTVISIPNLKKPA
jgi:putative tryptophan/tyrosine transport system permease protein